MASFGDLTLLRRAISAVTPRFRHSGAGDAAPDQRGRPAPLVIAGIAAAVLVGLPSVLLGGTSAVGAATSNLPEFPNNIAIFPSRDFVSVEGFIDYAGQTALVEVTRPNVGVVGSALVVVSGDDVAFEINHPGGVCWGAGTGLNVTPDIQAGDVVSMSFGGTVTAATTSLDVYASDAVQNGTTVTVSGHIGSDVDPANMEQRIIEPALVDTIIGKRDVRAVPGPMTPAPKGGYSSSLEFDLGAETFLATYIFDNEADAHIAANAGLGERAMAWEVTDPAGNRQGLTIAEFGEPGGPGMGGCPNGPLQSGPPGPTNVVAAAVPAGIAVNWTPAVGIPGAPAILGYEVTAVGATSVGGEQIQIGRRITNPGASSTTITGLATGEIYDIEIVSFSDVGSTFPVIHAAAVVTDVTPPTVTASPAGGSYPIAQQVTLTSTEIGSDIYYTIDGTDPVVGDQLNTPEPLHYTGPIDISSATTLKFAAFDPSNNVSDIGIEQYNITNDPVPAATAFTASSVGYNEVTLTWTAPDAGAPGLTITGYEIDVFATVDGTTAIQTVTANGDATSATISNLTGDTPYWFTISAKNDVNSSFGPASARLGPLTPQGDVVANAGFDQTGVARNTQVTLSGAGSTVTGATYVWTQLITGTSTPMPAGVDSVTLSPIPDQPQNVSFTLPLYSFPMVNTALTFQLAVTVGAVTMVDEVLITPRSDVVSISSARWKPRDFRVIGTSTTVGSVVTVRTATGTIYGTATVAADGSYSVRNRTNVPAARPTTIFVDSNMGGTAGPFTVSG